MRQDPQTSWLALVYHVSIVLLLLAYFLLNNMQFRQVIKLLEAMQ